MHCLPGSAFDRQSIWFRRRRGWLGPHVGVQCLCEFRVRESS